MRTDALFESHVRCRVVPQRWQILSQRVQGVCQLLATLQGRNHAVRVLRQHCRQGLCRRGIEFLPDGGVVKLHDQVRLLNRGNVTGRMGSGGTGKIEGDGMR